MNKKCLLEMQNINKEYFGSKVLKNINITVNEGEIRSLVGENGAGKSTLMNILFGMPLIHNTGGFGGKIFFNGKEVDLKSPWDAMNIGIGMVHQEFMLIPGFSITENIKLNREQTKHNLLSKLFGQKLKSLDFPSMRKDSRDVLDALDLSIDEMLPVAGLPVGYMQFIEIARELDKKNVKLIVFDEPTAVLTEIEAETLVKTMKILAEKGISILFITHRLEEVLKVSDNIMVLRDGEVVADLKTKDATVEKLAELMIGKKIGKFSINHTDRSSFNEDLDKISLKIEDLKVYMPGEEAKGVSLEIKKGEIFGIGGLAGQGKIGIANGVMGIYPSEGKIFKEGIEIKLNDTISAFNNRIAFVSEDRRGVGLLLDHSVELNIVIKAIQHQNKFLRKIGGLRLIDKKNITQYSLKMIKELDIRCRGPQQIIRRLSGGNQQKVCIANAITLEPEILFISEPTRGIDVGAKKIVLDHLKKLNQELGMTIIMTSSELIELRSICSRIAIIYRGKVAGILSPDASEVEFGLLMAGEKSYQKEIS